jgi:low affinity Fe/Cu permease
MRPDDPSASRREKKDPLQRRRKPCTSADVAEASSRSRRDGQPEPIYQFAERASHFASSPAFFAFCLVLVIAWLGGYAVDASTAYEQASGSALTATTLLLVALLKNAELRADHAVLSKLDALATGMLEAIRNEGKDADTMLQHAIRINEQVSDPTQHTRRHPQAHTVTVEDHRAAAIAMSWPAAPGLRRDPPPNGFAGQRSVRGGP